MDELEPRVRAVCDLNVAEAREYGGRHEYDGVPQDLSPDGVAAGLARLAAARDDGRPPLEDPHDEAHLRAFEDQQRVVYADLELHRRNPIYHLGELDLACYDKDYAPHAANGTPPAPPTLAAWPAVIDTAIGTLDLVPSPVVAASLLGGLRGLAAGIPADADPPVRGMRPYPRTSGWSRTWSGPRLVNGLPGRRARPGRAGRRAARRRRSDRRRPRRASPPGPTPSGTGSGARLDESAALIDPKRPSAMDVARETREGPPGPGGRDLLSPVLGRSRRSSSPGRAT